MNKTDVTEVKNMDGTVVIRHPDVLPVQVALANIMAELPAIGKDSQMGTGQYGYSYRGIETITAHLQPLLAKHGVVIIPRSTLVSITPALDAKPGWQDVILSVEWTIVGPDGTELTANTIGIGRDNSDKGANKAQSQAYKYALLQIFAISDRNDDSDGIDYAHAAEPEPTAIEILYEQVKATAGTEIGKGLKALAEASDKKLSAKALADDPDWADVVRIYITSTEGATNG